jgi:hypothetical protein
MLLLCECEGVGYAASYLIREEDPMAGISAGAMVNIRVAEASARGDVDVLDL